MRRSNGTSVYRTLDLSDPWAKGPAVYRTLNLKDPRSKGPSVYRAVTGVGDVDDNDEEVGKRKKKHNKIEEEGKGVRNWKRQEECGLSTLLYPRIHVVYKGGI